MIVDETDKKKEKKILLQKANGKEPSRKSPRKYLKTELEQNNKHILEKISKITRLINVM